MKRSALYLLPAMICLAILPARASVRGSFERSYPVTGAVDLQVLTRSGDIVVRSGPAGTVTVRGKIFVSDRLWDRWTEKPPAVTELEKNPPIRQSGNTINIDYVNMHNISIDYDITVPADTKLTTRTGSGDQTIEGLRTAADLESGSGDLRLHDMAGGLHIHTGSGNVEARDVDGRFSAVAGSGDIRMEAKGQGDVEARTGSGNVTLRGVNGTLRVETGSGDVNIDGTLAGNWELRTGSGDVEVRLPSDAAFDLDASTSSGDLNVDHPVTMTVVGRVERARHNISGKVRGGGPQLIAHTSSGDLHIY
ncbi:MAG TPA: DUF4097 family beta strand repeat-containing protein [Terriglobales bacterium]|nr:DUF4097 family beta strand repeat-containing protein [Terriglobales bacterium]